VVAGVYASLGRRMGERLFDEVVAATSLRPRLTPAKTVALVLAAMVHATTLLLLAGGLALIVTVHAVWSIVAGLLLILVAWATRPRLGTPPDRVEARGAVPAVYEALDRIAAAAAATRVNGIALTAAFNAGIGRAGWRRRTYMWIGVPLIEVMSPQERLAVLAHEVGHEVNGDPQRTGFIGSAISTVVAWHNLLVPGGPRRRGGPMHVAEVIVDAVLGVVAGAIRWFLRGMTHLVWHESQRAEYLADDIAARIAGSEATASAFAKFSLAPTYREAVQAAALERSPAGVPAAPGLFRDFRAQALARFAAGGGASAVRPSESTFRLDATHPPTNFRIAFVLSRNHPGTMTLTEEDSGKIDHELEPIEDRLQREIAEEYRASLYRGGRRR
jgi:Zn-dependent protease with chaperone function